MANQQLISFASSSSSSMSSSSSSSLRKYDVFLSFRGEDTRGNFTSHLREALEQKKVETYIDYRLQKGDEISPALIKAIEDSHVSVVIFSQNYASSKWCLAELTKIVECNKQHGQVVIPIFYNIDPSHVRKQTESYQQAFENHELNPNLNQSDLQKWKDALTQAANLSGWDSGTYETESQFIKDIVTDILQKLNLRYPIELKGLVGMEENYVMVESFLELGSREVRMVGIWGMGGIGKTALAIALHVKLCSQFEGHCFLTSVRERSEKYGLDVLRNELFSTLLKEKDLHFDVPKAEPHFVMRRLSRKRVLIVLDDVATTEQLEDLISNYHCLGSGSRVIVTTRNRHIFSEVDGIYKVKELNFHDSLQLFCLNAFRENHPKIGYEEISKSVIVHCNGNPLSLKVLGARLRSRSKEAWESELRKLQMIPDVKIQNVLKLSYDELDRTEQNIFLDIACFLKGESRDHVTRLLEACNFFAAIGIEVLLDKSLITISNVNKIEMHDLIQEMGWEIVHQESITDPGRRSRLWDPKEVYSVLKNNEGTDAIEGMILDVSKIDVLHLSYNSFAKMTNIRYLKFYSGNWSERCNIYLPNGIESLSDKLRYLQWHGYHLESLPSTFCAKYLVELSMPHSHLEKLWDGVQNLVNLKEIDLSFSENLIEVPDLSMATNLEVLSLLECKSLSQVHPSILSLHKLKYLDLEGCTEVESLQTNVHLKSLRHLRLTHCSRLKEFSISSMELENLWLDGTVIPELPSSIWRCEKLKLVSLKGCDNLDSFRNALSHDPVMASITFLILSECKQLNSSNLCFILNGFRSLTRLHLENCFNLLALPDIGFLSSLRHLSLSGSNVASLSANIKNLLMLKELTLDNCKKLVSLPELPPSLQVLSAINCSSLDKDFTQLPIIEHHISFSLKNGLKEHPKFFFLPGAQVPESFSFQAEDNSITIHHLPQSGLCGFIFCLILSQSPPSSKYEFAECLIHTFAKRITKGVSLGNQNLISDHVLFWYCEFKESGDNSFLRKTQKGGLYDHEGMSFKFSILLESSSYMSRFGIKGCGVCPVYAFEYGYSGSSKDIVELEPDSATCIQELIPRAIGFGVNPYHFNEDDQTKKLQDVMNQTMTTAPGGKREPKILKDEDSCTSSIPDNEIAHFDTSNINSNQTVEVLEMNANQVNKCSEPDKLVIDNQHLDPDWDPITELEIILSNSYKLSPKSTHLTTASETEVQNPYVTAILEKLEILLETSLEILCLDNEVKRQFHHVLEELDLFEDQIPIKLRPLIDKLKRFIEDVDAGFATMHKTMQDYDKLLQSRSLLSKQLESAKVRQAEISSKVSQGKIQFENINSEIVKLEQKLSNLVATRDKLKRALDNCNDEKSKLMAEVAQWVPECKTIITSLKKAETSYKLALTNKKKAEDEWADLKKSFVANKI